MASRATHTAQHAVKRASSRPSSRPSWSGHLRISLVTFPVQLYPGSRSARNIPMHQIHEPSGKRVHIQPVVEGIGAISRDEIVKGYEYAKGKDVILTPEEIEKLRLPSTKTIDINEFVDVAEIDPIYYDKPYYIVPDGDVALESYGLFRQALKETGKAAIGEIVLSGKEHLASVRPYGKGMILETLRYADEVREAHGLFNDIETKKFDKEQLDLAKTLIKKKSSSFKIDEYDDSYEEALMDLIERKLKKLPIKKEPEPKDTNVVSLMAALKKSVGQSDEKKPAKKRAAKTAKKKTTAKTTKKKKAA